MTTENTYAAIDLGSNSFHMIVARLENGKIHVIDRMREMVRLGGGLQPDKTLTPDAQLRALDCLEKFGQRLDAIPEKHIRAVGTNTLRQVKQASDFLTDANRTLGHEIEIIAGREEARLVYLGVAHNLPTSSQPRLIVDIGGGSTEFIVGTGFTPDKRESLHMGCVSMSQALFPDNIVTYSSMHRAILRARLELRPIRHLFNAQQWDEAVGSSGTIRAIRSIVQKQGWCDVGITADALKKLSQLLIDTHDLSELSLDGLSEKRLPVFAGGVAVLSGIFEELGIEQMLVSDHALREGLLYDMLGRFDNKDVRETTVQALMTKFQIDTNQAARLETTSTSLLTQIAIPWKLDNPDSIHLLSWACRLHEVGLSIAHSQFHKHGAYLLSHSDMPGFNRQQQQIIALLVRGHRRKFPNKLFKELPDHKQKSTKRLCFLLRIAALLHRGRSTNNKPLVIMKVNKNDVKLKFPEGWLEKHPMTNAELENEAQFLENTSFSLTFE